MEKKTLKPHHIKQYPFGITDGVMVQTCTREPKGEGLPIGYKIGRVTGYSELTGVEVMFGEDEFPVDYELGEVKLVLLPLLNLFDDEFANIQEELSHFEIDKIESSLALGLDEGQCHIDNCFYGRLHQLFEKHFDVAGLIDAGLAVDINDLK